MHYAVFRGSDEVVSDKLFRQDDEAIPILRALLAAQGDIFIEDSYGATVVDDALTLGNREALNILIVDRGLNLTSSVLRGKYSVINKVLTELMYFRSPAMVPAWVVPVPFQKV